MADQLFFLFLLVRFFLFVFYFFCPLIETNDADRPGFLSHEKKLIFENGRVGSGLSGLLRGDHEPTGGEQTH